MSGIVFDFDGTLTAPGAIDFAAIRRAIGCPEESSIIHWIEEESVEERRKAALEVLLTAEEAAARSSIPREGAEAFVARFRSHGLPMGILTRNTERSLALAFKNFKLLEPSWFFPIITRDDPFPRKPQPDALLHIASLWKMKPSQLLFVGDYRDDIETAHRAGARSCWMVPPGGGPPPAYQPDLTCRSYEELLQRLESR